MLYKSLAVFRQASKHSIYVSSILSWVTQTHLFTPVYTDITNTKIGQKHKIKSRKAKIIYEQKF